MCYSLSAGNKILLGHSRPGRGLAHGDTMDLRRHAALLCLFAALPVLQALALEPAQGLDAYFRSSFPDNSDLRQKYFTSLITAPRDTVYAFGEKVLSSAKAGRVLVRGQKRSADFLVEFLNERDSGFDGPRAGSYIIQREPAKGYILQAKILLADDPTCYARLYPQAEATRLDVVMYGAVLKKGIYVPGLIYYVLTKPFSEIVAGSKGAFDWGTALAPGAGGEAEASPADRDRAQDLSLRLAQAPSLEAFLAGPAGRGPVELAGPFAAQGLADDRDPRASRLPYGEFPRYEPGKGVPAQALRAVLYLDSLASPGSVYAVSGDGLRFVATPSPGLAGPSSFDFLSAGRDLSWTEIAAQAGKFRILRLSEEE